MKARVKGTTSIIDVTFDKDALNAGYPPYKAGGGIYYYPEQLVWIDNIDSAEPDYWEKLKHQYAGMALQGILSNKELFNTITDGAWPPNKYVYIAERCDKYATALVNRLKEDKS